MSIYELDKNDSIYKKGHYKLTEKEYLEVKKVN